jgi:hypothetical protein
MPERLVIKRLPPEGFTLMPRVRERVTKYSPHYVFARTVDGGLPTAIVLLIRRLGHEDFSISRNCLDYFAPASRARYSSSLFHFSDNGSDLVYRTMTCAEMLDATRAAIWLRSIDGSEICWLTGEGIAASPFGRSGWARAPWERE